MKKILIFILFLAIFTYNLLAALGWEKPEIVSYNQFDNQYPSVFETKGITFVVWTTYKQGIPSIYYNYKDTIWQQPELVTQFKKNKIVVPKIILKDNSLYVFLSDENNKIQVYYKQFPSNENFKNIILNPNEDFSDLPHPYSDNNQIFLFYQEWKNREEIHINYFPKLEIQDQEKISKSLIKIKKTELGSFFPLIQFDQNNIFVLWVDRYGDNNLRKDSAFFKTSDDLGQDWSEEYKLTGEDEDVQFPVFLVNEKKINLIYKTIQSNKTLLMLKQYELKNKKMILTQPLDFNFSDYYDLKLNFFNDRYYLFWYTTYKNNSDIYFSESEDFIRWETPIKITDGIRNNRRINILTQNDFSLVYESGSKNNSFIYYQKKDVFCPRPVISFSTHASNQWSYENTGIIQWNIAQDVSGIKSFCFVLDNNPGTVPEIENVPGEIFSYRFNNLNNGIHYFHIRAVDRANNYSETTHYKIKINTTPLEPPQIFSSTHEEFIPSENKSPLFFWRVQDNRPVKGFSYLMTQDDNKIPLNTINIQKTNLAFQNLANGVWYFKIRACDSLNRWSETSTFTVSLEDMMIASKMTFSEEAQSTYSYIVNEGDILSAVLRKLFQIDNEYEWRDYERAIGKFNYIQNLDFLKPGDILMFPIILAKPKDTLEDLAQHIYGDKSKVDRFVIIDKSIRVLETGDKIIVKDKYFLATGKIPQ